MSFQWIFEPSLSSEAAKNLAEQLSIPTVIAQILLNRGLESPEDVKHFFRAGLESLYDPYLMAGMDAAVARVSRAIDKKEHILIYGDYDVDGTTATAMMILLFRRLGVPVSYHIPNRIKDGYGLSIDSISNLNKKDLDLIITVDCGITATEEIAHARELGIDIVVCDHHQPGPTLPEANAILNPKRSNCPYPFKELAGVGVAFKLAQALMQKYGFAVVDFPELLELVAIGSAADIVPLVDENRILVRAGLERLNRTENLGLRALLNSTNLSRKTIGTGQIIFVLAPRINAVGRMGDASRAVELLTTTNDREAEAIAGILEQENRQRRSVDEETFQQAIQMIETQFDPANDPAFVLSAEGWHPGVIGIVASRIVERYYRPTIMISTEDGVGKGSARSIPGFNIYGALEACADLMHTFGGHKYAAGLSISSENIGDLRQRLHQHAASLMTEELLTQKLRIEGEIRFSEIDGRILRILKMMAPFGPQNMRPVFVSRGVSVVGSPAIVGHNHLRFKARQEGKVIDTIGFNLGGLMHRLQGSNGDLEIAYLIEENEWQGRVSTQLRLKDLR